MVAVKALQIVVFLIALCKDPLQEGSFGAHVAQEPEKKEKGRQGFLEEDNREEENWSLPTGNCSPITAPRFLDTCKTHVASVGTAAKPVKPLGVQEMQDSHGDGTDEMQFVFWLVGTSSDQSTGAQQEEIQIEIEGSTKKPTGGASHYEPLQREATKDGKELSGPMACHYPTDEGGDDDARASKGSNSSGTTTQGRSCKFLSIWDFWANRCNPTPESARYPQGRRRPDHGAQASTECGRGAKRGTQTYPSEQASELKTQHHQAGRKACRRRHRMACFSTEDVREIQSTEGSLSYDQKGLERGDCREDRHLQRGSRRDQEQNTTDRPQERGEGGSHRSGSPQAALGESAAGRRDGSHSSRQPHEEIPEDNRSGQRVDYRTENLKLRMLETLKASRRIEGGYHLGHFAIRSRHLDEISEIDAVVFGSLISIFCCAALWTLGFGILCLGQFSLSYAEGIGREGLSQSESHRAREWEVCMRWTYLFLSVCAVYSRMSHSRFEQTEIRWDSALGKSWLESEFETFDFAGRLCYAAFENSISSAWQNAMAIWITGIIGAFFWLLFERFRETLPRRSSTWRQRISVCSRRRSVRRRLVFHPVKFSQVLIAYCLLWDHCGVLAGNILAQSSDRHEDCLSERFEQKNDARNAFPTTARGQKHFIFELWLHKISWTTSFTNYRQLMVLDLRRGYKEQIRETRNVRARNNEGHDNSPLSNEDNEEESRAPSEATLLLQLNSTGKWRPSATGDASTRLPPPGNGPKVRFSNIVNVNGTRRIDHSITNKYIEGFCATREDADDDPRTRSFLHDLRFEDSLDHEGEDTTGAGMEESKQGDDHKDDTLMATRLDGRSTSTDGLHLTNLPIEEEHNLDDENAELGHEEGALPILTEAEIGNFHEPCRHYQDSQKFQGEVDVRKLMDVREWFDKFLPITKFERETINWKPICHEWIWLPDWNWRQEEEWHFYTDGSHNKEKLGAAAILFVNNQDTWTFGGFQFEKVPSTPQKQARYSAYDAELFAQAMAAKWAIAMCQLHYFRYGIYPKIFFHFDATSAGRGAGGICSGDLSNPYFVLARSLHHILANGLRVECTYAHQKAHSENPGNEAADVLANEATLTGEESSAWSYLLNLEGNKYIQWLWWTFRDDFWELFDNGFLRIPKPLAEADPHILNTLQKQNENEQIDEQPFYVKLACYNVQTFNAHRGRRAEEFAGSPTKTAILLDWMKKNGITIFGLQETRLRRNIARNKDFHTYQTLANQKGQGGILIGISKSQPTFYDSGIEGIIHDDEIKICHGDPELLILRVQSRNLQALIVCGHAPHTGYAEIDVQRWWNDLQEKIDKAGNGLETILLIDANSRVGSSTTENIGDHQAEEESFGGDKLHAVLKQSHIWLPSTFRMCQTGPGSTWRHPSGKESRIDFIGLPMSWKTLWCRTFVVQDFSITSSDYDHLPVVGEVQGHMQRWKQKNTNQFGHRMRRIDCSDTTVRQHFREAYAQMPQPSWKMDVHAHVEHMNDYAFRAVRTLPKAAQVLRRKSHLSEETWYWIEVKRRDRGNFFYFKNTVRTIQLQLFWTIWRHGENEEHLHYDLKDALRNLAINEHRMIAANREVKKRVREEDERFFGQFGDAMKAADQGNQQKELWKEVRRYMPKARAKKRAQDPKKIKDLEDKWAPHICQTEAGQEKELHTIFQDCLNRQNRTEVGMNEILELPSLVETECALRRAKVNKASGPDGGFTTSLPIWHQQPGNSISNRHCGWLSLFSTKEVPYACFTRKARYMTQRLIER